jgi:cytochrome c553
MPRLVLLAALWLAVATAPHAQEFDAASEAAEVCAACHGADGIPANPEAPVIAGQQFYYLYVQLRDYAAGRRQNDTMTPMASNYTKEQMQALATWFSQQPWPDLPAESAADVASEAQRAMSAGECSQCHNQYLGDSRIPRLAGQSVTYLDQTMRDFKTDTRKNAADMSNLLESYSDDDLQAIAKYLAAL